MEAHSPSLDQLRKNAAECIRLAEEARTSAHKSFFIEMAERWVGLAEQAEKTQEVGVLVSSGTAARRRTDSLP
jgi:hypothetical protein